MEVSAYIGGKDRDGECFGLFPGAWGWWWDEPLSFCFDSFLDALATLDPLERFIPQWQYLVDLDDRCYRLRVTVFLKSDNIDEGIVYWIGDTVGVKSVRWRGKEYSTNEEKNEFQRLITLVLGGLVFKTPICPQMCI